MNIDREATDKWIVVIKCDNELGLVSGNLEQIYISTDFWKNEIEWYRGNLGWLLAKRDIEHGVIKYVDEE
jgi:hypothetical protein